MSVPDSFGLMGKYFGSDFMSTSGIMLSKCFEFVFKFIGSECGVTRSSVESSELGNLAVSLALLLPTMGSMAAERRRTL